MSDDVVVQADAPADAPANEPDEIVLDPTNYRSPDVPSVADEARARLEARQQVERDTLEEQIALGAYAS